MARRPIFVDGKPMELETSFTRQTLYWNREQVSDVPAFLRHRVSHRFRDASNGSDFDVRVYGSMLGYLVSRDGLLVAESKPTVLLGALFGLLASLRLVLFLMRDFDYSNLIQFGIWTFVAAMWTAPYFMWRRDKRNLRAPSTTGSATAGA